ncbi:hypothetical protein D3C81_2305700 [compost metagenome]
MPVGIVALGLHGGADALGVGKAMQRGFCLISTRHGVVDHGPAFDFAVDVDAIAVDQTMSVFGMRVAVEIAFFGR